MATVTLLMKQYLSEQQTNALPSVIDKRGSDFSRLLISWYRDNHRLYAWRQERNPYKVLVAEVLLQQTNADRVALVYDELLSKYPHPSALAQSKPDELKTILKPLGLNYRAPRLRSMAERLLTEYNGDVPFRPEALMTLPGVGRYIANAVLCFAYGRRLAVVDVNVCRVYERVFGLRSMKSRSREDQKIWEFAQNIMPYKEYQYYNLALIDFSAAICTSKKPKCNSCPISDMCHYESKGS